MSMGRTAVRPIGINFRTPLSNTNRKAKVHKKTAVDDPLL
jgi:hypothetical protein